MKRKAEETGKSREEKDHKGTAFSSFSEIAHRGVSGSCAETSQQTDERGDEFHIGKRRPDDGERAGKRGYDGAYLKSNVLLL